MREAPISVPPQTRRDHVLRIADELRSLFDPQEIDRVAQNYGILLIRKAGSRNGAAGFAHIEYHRHPEFIESLARPGEKIPVWESNEKERFLSIVINTKSSIHENEIFWHEFYHLFYSPEGIQKTIGFEHRFHMEISDSIEERRADAFAAAMLIPSIEYCATVFDIMERFSVSERLAQCALKLYSAELAHE